jgi:hypothetical protein
MPTSGRQGIVAADLLLSLAAVLLLLVALMAPDWRAALRDSAPGVPDVIPLPAGRALILAVDGELHLVAGAGVLVLDDRALPDDPRLDAWLAQRPGADLTLALAHDSGDTGFLAEVSLTRAGVAQIDRLRLPGPCAGLDLTSDGAICHPARR